MSRAISSLVGGIETRRFDHPVVSSGSLIGPPPIDLSHKGSSEVKRLKPPADVLDIALSLAARNIYVFPVSITQDANGRRTKKPMLRASWTDIATTDAEQIATWWSIDYPNAWIGVHAGKSGLVVVDIDVSATYNGKESIAAAKRELPPTFSYPTLSGGRHFVYSAPPKTDLTIAKDVHGMRGVDIRAGNGFMVYYGPKMTPPTVFTAAPSWAVIPRRAPAAVEYAGNVASWLAEHKGKPDKVMRENVIPAADFDHNVMRDLVWAIVGDGANGHPGAKRTLAELRDAYTRPPWDQGQYADDFDKALVGAVTSKGVGLTTLDGPSKPDTPKLTDAPIGAQDDDVDDEDPIVVLRIPDLLNRKPPEWIVDNLLQQSTVALLAGEPGIGKSFLCLDIALRVAAGIDFHGREVRPGRVLYVVAEGAASFGKRVVAWQGFNDTTVPVDRVGFIETGVNLSDDESMVEMARVIRREEADLVILDTLSQLSEVENENDAAQLAGVLRVARELREARPGSTVLIVHHTNKGEKTRVRGSSAIRANVDTVIVATSDSSGGFSISTDVSHDGKQKDGVSETMRGFIISPHEESAVIERANTYEQDSRLVDMIELVLADEEWHTIADFQAEPEWEGTAPSRRIRRKLQYLVSTFAVDVEGTSRDKRWRFHQGDAPEKVMVDPS